MEPDNLVCYHLDDLARAYHRLRYAAALGYQGGTNQVHLFAFRLEAGRLCHLK